MPLDLLKDCILSSSSCSSLIIYTTLWQCQHQSRLSRISSCVESGLMNRTGSDLFSHFDFRFVYLCSWEGAVSLFFRLEVKNEKTLFEDTRSEQMSVLFNGSVKWMIKTFGIRFAIHSEWVGQIITESIVQASHWSKTYLWTIHSFYGTSLKCFPAINIHLIDGANYTG